MNKKRISSKRITELAPNEIFVYGSNLQGMHSGGAARMAYEDFGAVCGKGMGLYGQSYAIPTMQGGVETIKPYVDDFVQFAIVHKELDFSHRNSLRHCGFYTSRNFTAVFQSC